MTICATQKLCLFGEVMAGDVRLSSIGELADSAWTDLPNHTVGLVLDAWVIMPNHLHGIIILPGTSAPTHKPEGAPRGPTTASLGSVVGGFKSAVSRQVNACELTPVRPIWQRNYYERIIRDDRELNAVRRYIAENPANWNDDAEHPRFHAKSRL